MIRIYNNILPLKGFKAMNICGILLVRKGKVMTDKNIRHEKMKEMLYIGFYLWYVIEWLIRLILCMSAKRAYYSISFEQEAYKYQEDVSYLEGRRRYEWLMMMIDE